MNNPKDSTFDPEKAIKHIDELQKKKIAEEANAASTQESSPSPITAPAPETPGLAAAKEELLSRVITTMICKAIFAGVVLYLIYGRGNERVERPSVFLLAAAFLGLYAIASLFVFSFKLTGNYIVGIVVGVALLLGIGYLFDRINIFEFDSLGTDILLFILMTAPLFFEIRKVVRLAKMR